jgi:hypothetical protein
MPPSAKASAPVHLSGYSPSGYRQPYTTACNLIQNTLSNLFKIYSEWIYTIPLGAHEKWLCNASAPAQDASAQMSPYGAPPRQAAHDDLHDHIVGLQELARYHSQR